MVFRSLTQTILACILHVHFCQSLAQTHTNLSSNLVAHYQFSGNANDSTTNAIHGVPSNASFDSDRFGVPKRAIRFTGNRSPESHVTFPSEDARRNPLDLTSDFTVTVWTKFEGGTHGPRVVSATRFFLAFGHPERDLNPVRFGVSTFRGDTYDASSFNSFPKGQWLQLVGRLASNNLSLFVNGRREATGRTPLPPRPLYNYAPYVPKVAGKAGSDADAFGGLVDDLRFYSRALSDSEIEKLYELELHPAETLFFGINPVNVAVKLEPGVRYQFQFSADLHSWEPASQQLIDAGNLFELDLETDSTSRYFRLLRIP